MFETKKCERRVIIKMGKKMEEKETERKKRTILKFMNPPTFVGIRFVISLKKEEKGKKKERREEREGNLFYDVLLLLLSLAAIILNARRFLKPGSASLTPLSDTRQTREPVANNNPEISLSQEPKIKSNFFTKTTRNDDFGEGAISKRE